MDFTARYKLLNQNQQKAVDTIDGPVMVVAGPGTGKTELLSMRAANILRQTDTLPESILCLTFTESGAQAMRQRLTQIIGSAAYKIAIHTFHSFGSEIINQNSQFFYSGADFKPADELLSQQIITQILDELDYNNPLASKMNGQYTHLRDILASLSDLKRSGLTSDELLTIIEDNQAVLDALETNLGQIFSKRISAATAEQLTPIAHQAAALPAQKLPGGINSLSTNLALSLAQAIDQATADNSTKPITAWKNKWLSKNNQNQFVFKDQARHQKLKALSFVYFQYLTRMQEAELYDFDDMILRVVHALEVFDELRFNLQEKFQYIMVDEFQDTNLAQMRILSSLTNNPVVEQKPNILVVGDDDQAIYSFQGADISNILNFKQKFSTAQIIPLTDNYRSGEPILQSARQIITQGDQRLENYIPQLDKTLKAHQTGASNVKIMQADNTNDERTWLAREIQQKIKNGQKANQIAVLARKHSELIDLLPFLAAQNIKVNYERRDNVLQLEPIKVMIQTVRLITLLAQNQIEQANALLPELLAWPVWGFSNQALWQLSLKSYQNRQTWLEQMQLMPEFKDFTDWLIDLARQSQTEQFETVLDLIIGSTTQVNDNKKIEQDSSEPKKFSSPFFEYYFGPQALEAQPDLYLRHSEALRTIRHKLLDHHQQKILKLSDFINLVDLFEKNQINLTSVTMSGEQTDAIWLMTAHKSKGLEFDEVYIFNAVDSVWGERARGGSRKISYPENLPLAPAGSSFDERLRLFFVACTRAKQNLTISYAAQDDNGRSLEVASFLAEQKTQKITDNPDKTIELNQSNVDKQWYIRFSEPAKDLRSTLQPILEQYKLSATHLTNFLDVTDGGPQKFLVNNLLRFPSAMSPASAYGSAVHAALQKAHAHLSATKKPRAQEDILHDFENFLAQYRLSKKDFEDYSQKGSDALHAFLAQEYQTFKPEQKVELNFANQQALYKQAHLTGKLDLVEIDSNQKTVIITDYKTGKPSADWKGKTEWEKIKLHRYQQQLMFYKLLVESSRDFSKFTVSQSYLQFVEPDFDGQILKLSNQFEEQEFADFKLLVKAVWRKIINLDLIKTDDYEPNLKGILAFEQDLIEGKV